MIVSGSGVRRNHNNYLRKLDNISIWFKYELIVGSTITEEETNVINHGWL